MWNALGELGYEDEDNDSFYYDNDDDYSDSYASYLSSDDDRSSIGRDELLKKSIFAAISERRLRDLKGLIDSSNLSLGMRFDCLSHAVSGDQMVAAKLILRSTCHSVDVSNNETSLFINNGMKNPLKFGETFLTFAVNRKDEKVLKLLLNEGIVVHLPVDSLQSSIRIAVQRQFPQIVEHLLIHGADVNSQSPNIYDETLLHTAVGRGSKSIVELLVNFGANVNATKADRSTPLHSAAQNGFLEIAKFLLKEGAQINPTVASNQSAPSITGICCTPLQAAIQSGHKEIVKLLLDSGADVNARDSHGNTVFHYAVENMCPEILTYVLNYCPCVNYESDRCVLYSVVRSIGTENSKIILKKLLNYGFTFNSEDKNNSDLLFSAVRGNFFDVTRSLLEYGARINKLYTGSNHYFKFCSSLLHVAVIRGDVDMIKLLMDHGANPNIRNIDGKTPLLFAVALSDSEVAKLLLEREANVFNEELLVLAVEKSSMEVIKIMVEKGIDVNKKVSLEIQLYEKLSLLKTHGQLPHFTIYLGFDSVFNREPRTRTALDLAADLGRHEVVKLLLEHGADIDCSPDQCTMTLLSLSARQGHFETVKLLLEKGAKITEADKFEKTVLHVAAKFGHFEVVKLLLKHGAEINAEDKVGNSPLFIAAVENHFKVVEVLLDFGAKVENKVTGESVVDVAIRSNDCKVVKLLLEYGAKIGKSENLHSLLINLIKQRKSQTVELLLKCGVNINVKSSWEKSLLYVAAEVNSKKLVKLLLDHNSKICGAQEASAFINFGDSNGETALHVAAEGGSSKVVQVLLIYDASVNCKTRYGATPLSKSAGKGYLNIVETLLEANADINSTDKGGRSPLYNASSKGRVRIVRLLLKRGAASDIKTCSGETPLSISAKNGYLDSVKALVKSKAVINPVDEKQLPRSPPKDDLVLNSRQGQSSMPLYNAAEGGHIKIVKLLLENGAPIDFMRPDGETPLSIAAGKGHFKTVKALLKAGAVVNLTDAATSPLYNAARNGHVKVVKLLLQNGAVTETRDHYGETPLSVASKQTNVNLVQTLLIAGANTESSDVKGKAAIHHAIRRGRYEIVELLLQHGAKVDSKDVAGRTPLIISVQTHGRRKDFEMDIYPGCGNLEQSSGHEEVKLLLKYGADVDVKNTKGETPLFISAKYRQLESVKALLEAGADIHSSDSSGRTPLYIAATKRDSQEIVKILLVYSTEIDSMTLSKLKYVLSRFSFHDNPDFYYDTGSNEMDLRAAKMVAYHFVKMQTVNLFGDSEIFEALNVSKETKFNEFQHKCELEVVKMMHEYVSNTNVSFYEILKKNMVQLAAFAKNSSAVKILTTGDYKIKFPIYADIIDTQIRKGELRKNLVEQGVKLFYFLISEYADLPCDVIEKVFRYLSIKDLRKLINTCKPIEAFLSYPLLPSSSLENLDLFD